MDLEEAASAADLTTTSMDTDTTLMTHATGSAILT